MSKYYYIFSLIFLCLGFQSAFAQRDSIPADNTLTRSVHSTKQISLLTCGVGKDLYTSFGHTAIRIKYLQNNKDIVYNYGTFNFSDSLFYVKFTLGKLNYYLNKESFNDFIYAYQVENRSVKEQVLNLDEEDIDEIEQFLEYNALPQNRDYKYDFVFDNCATRVRDVFENVLAPQFVYGDILQDNKVSFRAVINEYLAQQHWARLGINLLLGSQMDSLMNTGSALFLPDLLHGAMASATLNSKEVVAKDITLNEGQPIQKNTNWPLIVGIVLLCFSLIVFNVKSLAGIRNLWSRLILFVFGALGLLMLFMWLGTDHRACSNNYNILWAVPTHFFAAFLKFKGKPWVRLYAFASISLLIVAILVHILAIQVMPLIEIIALFIILMLVYIEMYKQSIAVAKTK